MSEPGADGFEAHEYVVVELRHITPNTQAVVSHKIEVSVDVTVGALKDDFHHMFGCPPDHLKWTYKGQVLNKEKTLKFYGITDKVKPAVITVERI